MTRLSDRAPAPEPAAATAADPTVEQNRAAAPGRSVWVSANAGSGKTKVLTDRVARLLLGGAAPQRILCLTYTKAAAAEMQNRLFRRLGEWAMLDDAELAARLTAMGEAPGAIDSTRLRTARTLFARALETPGGLKIQTFHSFCAGLLRRFPLEAGVSPQFTEADQRAGKRLRAEIVEELAETHETVFDRLARHLSGNEFDKLLGEILRHRDAYAAEADEAAIWARFGLRAGFDGAALLADVFTGGEAALIAAIIPIFEAGGGNDLKAAQKLEILDLARPGRDTVAALEGVFLVGSGPAVDTARVGILPKRATQPAIEHLQPAFDDFMRRVERARPLRRQLLAAERALALHRFAHLFTAEYARRKQALGWLDFDDLIDGARALLSESAVAQWVLFRLDGGLDHILVDEAQDTSPEQWEVIWKLAEEFTAGLGARPDVARTVFVVGDPKQSIFSFQGADATGFKAMKDRFSARLSAMGEALESADLHFSFRSAGALLRVVDTTFGDGAPAGVARGLTHRAFKAKLPGRVDVWPFTAKAERAEAPEWFQPVDMPGADDPAIRLAALIAARLRAMFESGEHIPIEESGTLSSRPATPGDILILVQKRSAIFHEIIRALKAEGLPVAGSDRLKIGAQLAVKDLTALLSFLATPGDDLSLACALRSPLLGLSEGQLYGLAQGRSASLWGALGDRAADFPETCAMLADLRAAADYLRPFELLERILTRHGGRMRLVARLGREVEEGLDALLAEAMGYERTDVPSLAGFLGWLASDEVEIKRQMDSASNQIRVMTVHGAKGLEAPVVILPDTAKLNSPGGGQLYRLGDATVGWLPKVADAPDLLDAARSESKQRQEEERMRLLYVAMTRAESWLIVCGAGDAGKGAESWYNIVRAGAEAAGAVTQDFAGEAGLRVEGGNWPTPQARPDTTATPIIAGLPGWASSRAPVPERAPEPVSPSTLGGAKVLQGDAPPDAEFGADAAMRRGTQLHRLLEELPARSRDTWPEITAWLVPDGTGAQAERAALLAEATGVLDNLALAPVFAADALTEVGITAPRAGPGGAPLLGYIDRLLVSSERVLAVDFKTNALIPATPKEVPDGLLRQMGAYHAALSLLYPDRPVEVAILWTRTASLMYLPNDIVSAAYAATPTP